MLSAIEYGYARSASGGYENDPVSGWSTGESVDAPIANKEIANPTTSVYKCATSVRISRLLVFIPPTTSTLMKTIQSITTVQIFLIDVDRVLASAARFPPSENPQPVPQVILSTIGLVFSYDALS
jgi:hypothetical protein